ncbi:uncharacterized protein SPPG_06596 [Spizellomyces punctatus DAOM BR117]|uniref:3'-5' exonuclease n=1 Tax=Spizellomyces punctatus (strain DAOM BR117) TaxID=645134 RepID=A0A0L0HBG0_SPIPD|nr:uncharacterized protein SPPG_06596 [Spizellomyces punctatus DAOM BR117]KNC98194.1 hypothetical protein SPPG_06596 [Spizellomyces punctatus DAOM BR117]|eukprot:XP_016606234.1 hypothetical protein SPPG_06596 [Spizellomyces punctatus DAOM BR117]
MYRQVELFARTVAQLLFRQNMSTVAGVENTTRRVLPWTVKASKEPVHKRQLPNIWVSPPKQADKGPALPKLDYRSDKVNYEVVYARSTRAINEAVNKCRGDVIGFDMEWKPTFVRGEAQRPTALIQLCNERYIGLLHICHVVKFPPPLREILEDASIVKLGLNIQGDARKLHRDFGIQMAGWLELGTLAKEVAVASERRTLQALVEKLLHAHLDKTSSIRTGNWEALVLSEAQREYAANDAYAAYKVYNALMKLRSGLANEDQLPMQLGGMADILQREARQDELEIDLEEKRRRVNKASSDDYFGDDQSATTASSHVQEDASSDKGSVVQNPICMDDKRSSPARTQAVRYKRTRVKKKMTGSLHIDKRCTTLDGASLSNENATICERTKVDVRSYSTSHQSCVVNNIERKGKDTVDLPSMAVPPASRECVSIECAQSCLGSHEKLNDSELNSHTNPNDNGTLQDIIKVCDTSGGTPGQGRGDLAVEHECIFGVKNWPPPTSSEIRELQNRDALPVSIGFCR